MTREKRPHREVVKSLRSYDNRVESMQYQVLRSTKQHSAMMKSVRFLLLHL